MDPKTGIWPILKRVLSAYLPDQKRQADKRMNLPVVFAAALIMVLGLIAFRPQTIPPENGHPKPYDRAAEPADPQHLPDTVVTRLQSSLLAPVLSEQVIEMDAGAFDQSQDVSEALRHPIRLLNTQRSPTSLRDLVHDTLVAFEHPVSDNDPLFRLLVQLLSERQSNTYIEAALQQAHARGEISIPDVLADGAGGVDTQVLLGGLVYMNSGNHGLPMPATEARMFGSERGLSAMALD